MNTSMWGEIFKKKQFRYSILLMMFYAGFVLAMDSGKVTSLSAFWSEALKMQPEQVSQIMASTNIGMIPMLFLGGVLADWLGGKKVVFWSVLLGSIISGLMALVKSYDEMYFRNVLFGLCYGAVTPGAMRLIAQWFPAKDVTGAAAVYYGGMLASGLLGTPVAIFIANHFGWQFAFLFVAAVGIPCAIWILFGATERPENKKGITEGELKYIQEGRAAAEKVPFKEILKALSNKNVLIIALCAAIGTAPTFLFAWVYYGTMVYAGVNPDVAGVVLPLALGASAVYGIFHGDVVVKIFKGNLRLLMAFGGLLAAAFTLLAAFWTSAPWWLWAFFILFFGALTNSFLNSVAPSYYVGAVGPKVVGSLVGVNSIIQTTIGWFLTNYSGQWLNTEATGLAVVKPVYIIAACVYLIPVVLVWFAKDVNVLKLSQAAGEAEAATPAVPSH